MYASNEDEFHREDDEWVFLRQTPPATTIPQGAVNLLEHERSTSSSSSSSSSSKSEQSDSTSSLSSTERIFPLKIFVRSSSPLSNHEHGQNDDEGENQPLIEDPVLASQTIDDNQDLSSTGDIKEEVFSSEMMINQNHANETTPIINEYDLLTNGQDSSNEPVDQSDTLRRRTGATIQQTVEQHPVAAEEERLPQTMYYYHTEGNQASVTLGFSILLLGVILIFGGVILSQRSTINKMTRDLKMTNHRLDEIKIFSIENMERKLTKQFDDKFQKLIQQKTTEFDEEKFSLILQINELYHIINLTQQNLTNTIQQSSDDHQQLRVQVVKLEQRLQRNEEQSSNEKEACPEGVDCKKSPIPSLEVVLAHLIKRTPSIAEDTSVNFSGLFEQLSASLSDLVDHRHEYVEESKRKLTDLVGSQTAEQVQTTLRRGVENLSSSLRQAQSTYAKWLRARAQQREQARMEQNKREEEQKPVRGPWRWTFQRGQDREQMRHQTPTTKKHVSNKEHVCRSKCQFPVNHMCTMKNWMEKLFHP